jgi:hypothetical protein
MLLHEGAERILAKNGGDGPCMQTILKMLGLASIAHSEAEILDLIDQESEKCVSSGDLLGAGEWYISKLSYCTVADDADLLLAKTVALWASPIDLTFSPTNLKHLANNILHFESGRRSCSCHQTAQRRALGGYEDRAERLR